MEQITVWNWETISCGVAQGSILKALFLVYTKDFHSKPEWAVLFADDTNISDHTIEGHPTFIEETGQHSLRVYYVLAWLIINNSKLKFTI